MAQCTRQAIIIRLATSATAPSRHSLPLQHRPMFLPPS
jgi:hypothetical protein